MSPLTTPPAQPCLMPNELDEQKVTDLLKSPNVLLKIIRATGVFVVALFTVLSVYFTIQKRLDQHDSLLAEMKVRVERIDQSVNQCVITQAVVLQKLESLRLAMDAQTRLIEALVSTQRRAP